MVQFQLSQTGPVVGGNGTTVSEQWEHCEPITDNAVSNQQTIQTVRQSGYINECDYQMDYRCFYFDTLKLYGLEESIRNQEKNLGVVCSWYATLVWC